jgi:hypothetical protein
LPFRKKRRKQNISTHCSGNPRISLTQVTLFFAGSGNPLPTIQSKLKPTNPVLRTGGKGHFMHIQPRNFDSQITERRRASSAVGGDGEASAPVAPTAADGAALALLLERSRTLAARVRVGEIEFLDAVDIAYSAAEFSNLVGRYGDDVVQAMLAIAFIDIPRRAAC